MALLNKAQTLRIGFTSGKCMDIRNIHQEQLSPCAVTMVSFFCAKALHTLSRDIPSGHCDHSF
jgi:hypothetical protein